MRDRDRCEGDPGHHLRERNYVLPVVAFSFLLGIMASLRIERGLWPLGLLPLAVGLWYGLKRAGIRPDLAVGIACFALGLLWTQGWSNPGAPAEGVYRIEGRVYGEPRLRAENRMTFYLNDVRLDGAVQQGRVYCTLRVYGEDPLPVLFDGAELLFDGQVYHPKGKSGPHDFDYRMWLHQNGISYGISGIKDLQIRNTPQTAPWNDMASHIHKWARESLARVMGDEARFAMAVLFSQREGIAADEAESFQTAGIAHVMTVSGLHVGVVGGLVMWMLNKFRVGRVWRLPLLALFLLGYCVLTGFSPPSVRAAIMLLSALLARYIGRRPDPVTALSLAMIILLLINPLLLFSAGFVLSLSAMAGILLLQPSLLQFLTGGDRSRIRRMAGPPDAEPSRMKARFRQLPVKAKEVLSFTIAAQLGVLLPAAFYFHQLPLYGVLINLLAAPVIGLLVPCCFVTLLLSPIPYISILAGGTAKALTAGLLWMVKLTAQLPYASIRTASAPPFILCGTALCAVLFSRYYRAGWKRRLAAIVLVGVLSVAGTAVTRSDDLRYVQLSVGRAEAALIMDGDITLAVDVGEDGAEMAGYLLAENRNIDGLFLTHLHSDHAGGVPALLNANIRISRVYLPVGAESQKIDPPMADIVEELRRRNIPITELAAGEEVRYNKVTLQALWPVRDKMRQGQDANDLPLVLSIDMDGYRILNTSDLTGAYEAYAASACDVLVVAHHGSGSSTGDAFLNFVSPGIALISCADGDRQLPALSTLRRLEKHGIDIYRTDERGDITLTVCDGRLELSTYK